MARTTPTTDWFDYMDRLLEDFRHEMLAEPTPRPTMPEVRIGEGRLPALTDVEDKGNVYEVRANLPGVRKENIRLRLLGRTLEIDARETVEKETNDKAFLRHERVYQSFGRVLDLPEDVVPEKTAARYQDGVLTVTVPKAHPEAERLISVT